MAAELKQWLRAEGFSDDAIRYAIAVPGVDTLFGTTQGRKNLKEHLRLWELQNPTAAATQYETAVQTLLPTIGPRVSPEDQARPQPHMSVNAAEYDVENFVPARGGGQTQLEVDPTTGAFRFKNGVIVDPTAEQVYYEPNSMAPGSTAWWAKVQATWTDDEIAEWRKKLYQMGYISSKDGGIDVDFKGAIREYYKQKYLNGGEEIAASSRPGSSAEEADRLHQTELKMLARGQYQKMFGTDPTDEEVADLSDWAQKTYVRLQKKRGLDPGRAASIVTAQAEDKVLEDPGARFVYKAQKRNTELHDSIINAVQMTEMLS